MIILTPSNFVKLVQILRLRQTHCRDQTLFLLVKELRERAGGSRAGGVRMNRKTA
jgi:hypothetical protein